MTITCVNPRVDNRTMILDLKIDNPRKVRKSLYKSVGGVQKEFSERVKGFNLRPGKAHQFLILLRERLTVRHPFIPVLPFISV